MNSSINKISMVKNEENLDAVEPAINNKKENFAFYILNKSIVLSFILILKEKNHILFMMKFHMENIILKLIIQN